MTPFERKMRQLAAKRRRARTRQATPPAAPTTRPCLYCGSKTTGLVCHAHEDVHAVDPFYHPHVPQKQEPAEVFRPEALLDRLKASA